jgi:hypothetical protein
MAMDKKMCVGALVVAGIMIVAFLLDAIFGYSGSITVDIFGILAGGIVAYLAFHALRELR